MRPLVALVLFAFPSIAAAQPGESAVAAGRAREVANRLAAEITCLSTVHQDAQRILRLMQEAEAQCQTTTGAARRDAEDAIRSLQQQLTDLETREARCRPAASARPPAPRSDVITVPPPADAVADRVATPNTSTRVVEGPGALVPNVAIVQGEQVDGTGRVDASAVRIAIRGLGPAIARCYDQLVGRGRLVRGQLVLTFTVSPSGAVQRVTTEGTSLGGSFPRCARSAATRLRVGSPAVGGDATFSYTFSLPE